MSLSPLRIVEDALVKALNRGEAIRSVLIGPDIWLGLLLQLNLPYNSKGLKELEYVHANPQIKEYMERVQFHANYHDEVELFFKLNPHVEGVRVLIYPEIR